MSFEQLHNKLKKHLDEQAKNWQSFIYAQETGFYQGFDEIKIDGCRPTEKRFERYNIDKYLGENKSVLDIGSNCGFFSLFVSRFVEQIDGVELNPYLISIANDTKDYLKNKNTTFHCTEFEKYENGKKYDVIFSFSNDSTIDDNTKFNFEEYIKKILTLLKEKGVLLFESQAIDALVPTAFEPKMKILERYFDIIENRMVESEYPVNVPKRIFLVLAKK